MLYDILKFLLSIFLRIFYRKIYISKLNFIPKDRPIILTGNHSNAFADALMIGCYTSWRKMNFIARGDAFKPKMLWFFKITRQIPIFRFRDGFENLKRNNKTMEYCYNLLKKNCWIVIFPEGNCVVENRLRPIQKGTARMVFGAYETHGLDNIEIIPISVNYIEHTRMRSSVTLSPGKSILLKDYIDIYNSNPNKGVKDLTDKIEENLKNEVLHIEQKGQDEIVKKGWLVLDQLEAAPFFAFKRESSLHKKAKTWVTNFNNKIEEKDTDWINGLNEFFQLCKNNNIDIRKKLKPSIALELLILIFLLPIGLPAFITYVPILLFSNFIVRSKIKPKIEFEASLRIGFSWFICIVFHLILAIIIGIKVGFIWALLSILLAPAAARIGIMWFEAVPNIIQSIHFMKLKGKDRLLFDQLLKKYFNAKIY